MNDCDSIPLSNGEAVEPHSNKKSYPTTNYRASVVEDHNRLIELEVENSRLHRLVAELLIKNQELRRVD